MHKGAFGDGGGGSPRRPCGPPRNDNDFLSFRGAERRGNPSFLRWTGDGPPGRRPLRKVYRSPSNGPMYLRHGFRRPNFVPKFGASVMGIGPYALRGDGGRHAGSSCPTGGCGRLHQLPGGSRRAAKRPRPQPRGMGGNRRKNHPKRRTAPATTQAALSEAESAEREAGQIRFLPDDLRVQHGVQCSEASAKPRTCSRRGCDN